jgi:hypothetical protein
MAALWGIHNDQSSLDPVEGGFISIGWDELGDGGVDVIASSRDPLAIEPPIIKVQCKADREHDRWARRPEARRRARVYRVNSSPQGRLYGSRDTENAMERQLATDLNGLRTRLGRKRIGCGRTRAALQPRSCADGTDALPGRRQHGEDQ